MTESSGLRWFVLYVGDLESSVRADPYIVAGFFIKEAGEEYIENRRKWHPNEKYILIRRKGLII